MCLLSLIPMLITILISRGGEGVSFSKTGCPERCGNVTIPYPFGIGSQCSSGGYFAVICNDTTNPPKPYLEVSSNPVGGKLEALEFSLDKKYVRVKQGAFPLMCNFTNKVILVGQILSSTPFRYSTFYNSLVVVGCKNELWLGNFGPNTSFGGCAPICGTNMPSCRGTNCCSGMNCCQTAIPSIYGEPEVFYTSQPSPTPTVCGYAFISDHRWLGTEYVNYIGTSSNFPDPANMSFGDIPMILEWEFDIPMESLRSPVVCRNESVSNSLSLDDGGGDSVNITRCYCEPGFEGNPYLPGGGCQDINECNNAASNYSICANGTTCVNTVGGYSCVRDDSVDKLKATIIGISSAMGALVLLGGAWMSSKAIRKRIKANRRKAFFKRNGGLLLEQQLSSSSDTGVDKIKLFSSKELALATDRYNENRILGRGGQGTVYKGMLPDGRIVAVKKSKKVEESDIEVFINEVVILSQINHRNIVKLLGCCLETEVPLLVYEFIPNGTLFQHIHDKNDEVFPLSWKMRVRIAAETAGALSYLHYAASVPIYHRDIKSSNILLDDKYRAKISDFGTSRSIAIDQTHLTTRVLGTFGYLDPEYFQSSQFTEKSDVYSFGVVLVELLTGQKAVSAVRDESGRNLASHFLHAMEENNLWKMLDPDVVKEGGAEDVETVARLAMRCLNLNGKKRPTMKEVAAGLEGIQMWKQGLDFQPNQETTEFHSSIQVYDDYDFTSTSNTTNFSVTTKDSSSEFPLLITNS